MVHLLDELNSSQVYINRVQAIYEQLGLFTTLNEMLSFVNIDLQFVLPLKAKIEQTLFFDK